MSWFVSFSVHRLTTPLTFSQATIQEEEKKFLDSGEDASVEPGSQTGAALKRGPTPTPEDREEPIRKASEADRNMEDEKGVQRVETPLANRSSSDRR
jgi:hypothetical protein